MNAVQSKAQAEGTSLNTQMSVLGSAERASKLALALFELLEAKGETALSNIAWVLHLKASQSAEMLGESLGVEVDPA